jgi:hypothetical protein
MPTTGKISINLEDFDGVLELVINGREVIHHPKYVMDGDVFVMDGNLKIMDGESWLI